MLKKLALALVLSLVFAASAHAQMYGQQPYTLIGVTDAVRALGNNGAGIKFGVIDTGIQSAWVGFGNRVDMVNSTCTIAGCAKTKADDNGHGTFVASEIMGNVAGKYQGIATSGTLIAIKALGANGSGLVSDVANGINTAVSKGAQILNLSLTFVPTAPLIAAINNAAAKGDLIVFAGGNDGAAFQNNARVNGLTDKAIQSLILMGSTGISKSVSYFSSKPGTGGFVSTTGKFYSFASIWAMADGEGVYGASLANTGGGYTYLTTMSGTSMAAPQAAGVAGLVAAKWPFLLTKNTLANVLLQSTTDLGTKGVDNVYGNGLLNAAAAFNPIGALTIPVNGQNVLVSAAQLQVNGTASGQAILKILQKGVGYDNFSRDFPINLGSGVGSGKTNTVTMSVYAIGSGSASGRSFTELGTDSWMTTSFAERAPNGADVIPNAAHSGFMQDPSHTANGSWSAGFYSAGTYMGGGYGSGAGYSFNDARWGEKTAFFDSNMAGAGSLLGLTEGSGYAAAGFDLNKHERVSFGVVMGKNDEMSQLMGNEVSSKGFSVGYTWKPEAAWGVSFTGAFLNEKNSLLGSASGGYLRLGENAKSMSMGVSSNFNLGDGLQLGFDAMIASTDPTDNSNSLIEHTSRLTSTGFGMTMRKENLTGVNDTLVASFKAPLRVTGGSANVNVPVGTDADGNPIFERAEASLAPEGRELDFSIGYVRPVAEKTKASFAFELRNDADNVPGAVDQAVMFRLTRGF